MLGVRKDQRQQYPYGSGYAAAIAMVTSQGGSVFESLACARLREILHDADDIPHLAALVAPRRLVIAGGVTGGGHSLDAGALDAAFAFTRQVYMVAGAADRLQRSRTPIRCAWPSRFGEDRR